MAHAFPDLHVLVVDDHQETAECLSAILKAAGFECRVAFDGLSALEAVRVFTPNVVLLDVCLPGLDGFELAKRLRTMPFKDDLILIALSGLDLYDGKEKCAKAGIDHVLMKPASPDLLVKLIRDACSIQRQLDKT